MPVASALTGTPTDCLIVASFGQQPEIQRLVCLEVKSFLLTFHNGWTDRHTTIIFLNIQTIVHKSTCIMENTSLALSKSQLLSDKHLQIVIQTLC